MKAKIYCECIEPGVHQFYIAIGGDDYFLFRQNFRKGVHSYFSNGVSLDQAMKYSKIHNDSALERTISKFPMYIKYVEKEYGVEILEQTKRRNSKNYASPVSKCA